jgi:hypothetical protein
MLASCTEAPALSPPLVAMQTTPRPFLPLAPAARPRQFPVPARKPTPPPLNDTVPTDTGETSVAMAEPGPAVNPPQQPMAPQASALVGLDEPAAAHLFGTATEQSIVPPATVWRYRNATCELDLFFYLDLRSGKMRALHYAFKGDSADPVARQDCLRSLVVARGS